MDNTYSGIIEVKKLGTVFVPRKYVNALDGEGTVKFFAGKDIQGDTKILKQIKKGGFAIISTRWKRVLELYAVVEQKKSELVGYIEGHVSQREWKWIYWSILNRLMVPVVNNQVQVQPEIEIPYLLEFLEERRDGEREKQYLISVYDLLKLEEALEEKHYLKALDQDYVIAHYNVLAPKSQETISLIRQAFEDIKEEWVDKEEIHLLDMGCGSGVLSILAARVFADKNIHVTSTDHLVEAVATTRLNVKRYEEEGKIPVGAVQTTEGGDLFEPVGEEKFDIMIFNAPWVVTQAKNRAETALNDEDQSTITRYIRDSWNHLKKGGHVLIGYADHSGDKAIERLEEIIAANNFQIHKLHKDKIQTRRSKNKWEAVLIYDLVAKE